MKKVGYTKYHTIKMHLREWYRRFMLRFWPPYRTKFCSDVVEDGVMELNVPKEDGGEHNIWVTKI